MIEEEASVSAVDGRQIWVETTRKPACAGCREACAGSEAGKLFGERIIRFPVSSPLELKPGDRVVIGLAEDALAKGSIGIYLVPLFGLFIGGLIGKLSADLTAWLEPEFGSALGGMLGLLCCLAGLKLSRFFDRTGFQPVILRKIN